MRSPLSRLAPLFRKHARLLGLGLAGMAAASGLQVLGPLVAAHAIDVALPAADRAGLLRDAGLVAVVLFLDFLVSFGARIALQIAAQRAMADLQERLFDHLLGLDVSFHDEVASGSLVGRVQSDTEALNVLFVEVVFALPADLLTVGAMMVVLGLRSPQIALPVFAVLPVYVLWFLLFRRIAPPYFVAQRKVVARLAGTMAETVRVASALRALGRQRWARERVATRIVEARRADVLSHLQPIWYFNGATAFRALATVAVLMIGAWRIDEGTASVGLLVIALSYLRQIFAPLMRMSNQLTTLERARAAAVRVTELLDRGPRIAEPEAPVPWPGLRDAITFEDVSFHYLEGTPVLDRVDLRIPAGSRLGIVGPTGSGKSTLLDLLLRFRDPVGGRVAIDGVALDELSLAELRRRTGLVLQDVRLLPGTVLDNLGGDAVAARSALDELGIDWPLERVVDDATLSRGERQLLTFARALARDPEVLVLDEATSAIDPATEHRVTEALERLLRGRTVIVVAHRLHTVRGCDQICVLRGGRIEECGPHEALVASGGLYAEMVRLQEAA
ncbi:MAG: ABC transporter ATP-binding protein [Alphaproteobacteria bacterium]|nr:ABC transporter ATP-binding protein [Alphaproteobacteria bacterium]MCB9697746.1 ABC transporter ATP-binding protein [Alphaproteobacteria bacterium]